MPPDTLITTLLEEGGRKKDEVIAHAREEASRIVDEARLRVEQADSRSLEAFRRQINDREAMKVNSARREARRIVEETRAQVIRQTLDAVLGHLEKLRQTGEYGEIVESLLGEVLHEFDGEAVVMAGSREMALIREIAGSHKHGNLKFEEVPGMSGGLEAKSPDGRIVVRNTFESRLARATDLLVEEMGKRMRACNV